MTVGETTNESVPVLEPAVLQRGSLLITALVVLAVALLPLFRPPLDGFTSDAILALPERERLILSLYYQEELQLKEIGQVLEVSESRVSQLMKQAVMRLRASLQAHGAAPVR